MDQQEKPAVIGDGRLFFGAQQVLRPVRYATLTELDGRKVAFQTPVSR
jgi:hypothetical protein